MQSQKKTGTPLTCRLCLIHSGFPPSLGRLGAGEKASRCNGVLGGRAGQVAGLGMEGRVLERIVWDCSKVRATGRQPAQQKSNKIRKRRINHSRKEFGGQPGHHFSQRPSLICSLQEPHEVDVRSHLLPVQLV
jgi:hypothetical protein